MDALTYLSLLRQHGHVDDGQIQLALEEQKTTGKPVIDLVADLGFLTKEEQYQMLADDMATTRIEDLNAYQFSPDLLSRIPPQTARLYGARDDSPRGSREL